MKCTNKILPVILFLFIFIFTGCGNTKYEIPYAVDSNISSFRMSTSSNTYHARVDSFAAKLCVADTDINPSSVGLEPDGCAALFSLNSRNTIYAENIHARMHPASLTKIMTAIVAKKNASPDMLLTATPGSVITDPSAQIIGLKAGDQMTLEQALNIMLVYSANDVALLIAEGVGGSVENFVNMMNEEALKLGATNTHFTNPHGLTDDEHYTTGYDLYLMLNEAVQYDLIKQIIGVPSYQTTYYDQAGNAVEVDVKNTNFYLIDKAKAPAGVTVAGGKTGTTSIAGHCLVLYAKDNSNNPYISIVMKASSRDLLYDEMNDVLKNIGN